MRSEWAHKLVSLLFFLFLFRKRDREIEKNKELARGRKRRSEKDAQRERQRCGHALRKEHMTKLGKQPRERERRNKASRRQSFRAESMSRHNRRTIAAQANGMADQLRRNFEIER